MIDLLNRIGFRQIAFGGEGGGGGGAGRNMVTAPKTRLVQKQPHLLAYITPAEAALLRRTAARVRWSTASLLFALLKGRPQVENRPQELGFLVAAAAVAAAVAVAQTQVI
jgi:hypothetical protein